MLLKTLHSCSWGQKSFSKRTHLGREQATSSESPQLLESFLLCWKLLGRWVSLSWVWGPFLFINRVSSGGTIMVVSATHLAQKDPFPTGYSSTVTWTPGLARCVWLWFWYWEHGWGWLQLRFSCCYYPGIRWGEGVEKLSLTCLPVDYEGVKFLILPLEAYSWFWLDIVRLLERGSCWRIWN